MYGYFRPNDSKLSPDEMKVFKAYYCRVCYCLRILGGQSARFFTTYDMAVYSLLLNMAQKRKRPQFHVCEKFATSVMHEYDNDGIGRKLANMSIIMFGEKIRDDEIDGSYLLSNGMKMLFSALISQACTSEPDMAKLARTGTDKINSLQSEHTEVNLVLEAYGQMVSDMFSCIDKIEDEYLCVIRSIAIWTFYIDMLHDYNKDYRTNSYNGFRVDGLSTIQECFDTYYCDFIRLSQLITREIRESLNHINDGSVEWRIVEKIVDNALSSVIVPIFSTQEKRWKMMLEYSKRNICCVRTRSNFR